MVTYTVSHSPYTRIYIAVIIELMIGLLWFIMGMGLVYKWLYVYAHRINSLGFFFLSCRISKIDD